MWRKYFIHFLFIIAKSSTQTVAALEDANYGKQT